MKKISYYSQNLIILLNNYGLHLFRVTYEDDVLLGTKFKCYMFFDEQNEYTYIIPVINLINKKIKEVEEGIVYYEEV